MFRKLRMFSERVTVTFHVMSTKCVIFVISKKQEKYIEKNLNLF